MQSIICDIDDTLLSSGSHPIKKTVDWINNHYGRYRIVLVTGRNVSQRSETIRQLHAADIKYNQLIMNPSNPGSAENTANYKYEIGKKVKPVLAIDNNARMRQAYERAGIKSIDPKDLNDNMLKMMLH